VGADKAYHQKSSCKDVGAEVSPHAARRMVNVTGMDERTTNSPAINQSADTQTRRGNLGWMKTVGAAANPLPGLERTSVGYFVAGTYNLVRWRVGMRWFE